MLTQQFQEVCHIGWQRRFEYQFVAGLRMPQLQPTGMQCLAGQDHRFPLATIFDLAQRDLRSSAVQPIAEDRATDVRQM